MISNSSQYEAETIPGLEPVAIEELSDLFGPELNSVRRSRPGFLRFQFSGAQEALSASRAVIAGYRVHHFDIPRPKALLGHEHFTRLTAILRRASASWGSAPETIGIGAAGSQSSVLLRLRKELAAALALRPADDGKGELYMRLARQRGGSGWEILVRTTRQPLSKRLYRVADVPGALNATVAYAMTRCGSLPDPGCVVNLCSGTSTILIEHGITRPSDNLIGVEYSADMINCGMRNARAAGNDIAIRHVQADARRTPLPAGTVDLIYADLPFGRHIGSHADNLTLYPDILREAQRLAREHTIFVVLTHEVKLMRRCLANSAWRILEEKTINLKGLHPRLFVLKQNSATIV